MLLQDIDYTENGIGMDTVLGRQRTYAVKSAIHYTISIDD
jgi:hypothetical protein